MRSMFFQFLVNLGIFRILRIVACKTYGKCKNSIPEDIGQTKVYSKLVLANDIDIVNIFFISISISKINYRNYRDIGVINRSSGFYG